MVGWVNTTPLWILGLLLLVTMIVALLVGHRIRTVMDRRRGDEKASETQEGYILGGVLSLLALLIGFTYALATDRYETRRVLVTEDARAIQTLYLRAQLLDQPHRDRISGLLLRYVDNRIRLAETPPGQ